MRFACVYNTFGLLICSPRCACVAALIKSAIEPFFSTNRSNNPSLIDAYGATYSNPPTERVDVIKNIVISSCSNFPSYSISTYVGCNDGNISIPFR